MAPSRQQIVDQILEKYGRTFSREVGIQIEKNTPSTLFRLLVFALLSSTRISHQSALNAAKALSKQGWNTPQKMAGATWRRRTDVLNQSGYARYDESTSRMLAETSEILLKDHKGDLRKLRAEAGRDPATERKLLKKFKGLGNVGADIFFREAQAVWDELMPFADQRAMKAAKRLGLGESVSDLQSMVKKEDFPRFVAGLVRIELEKDYSSFET
jgi:endonuclease III